MEAGTAAKSNCSLGTALRRVNSCVADAADGIVTAAELYDAPEPVNLGSGYEVPIRDLAEMIKRMVGFEGDLVWLTDKPNGQPRRALDVGRAKERFGWQASMPFEEGIRQTIDRTRAPANRLPA
jgi:GDP-L-fucose synthase